MPRPGFAAATTRRLSLSLLLAIALPCSGVAGGFLGKLGSTLGKLYQADNILFMLGNRGAEKRLGYLLARYYLLTNKVNRDPAVNQWVNGIFDRLKAAAPRSRYTYRIHVINSPQINAFALPGGTVFIYRGMLDFAQSDDEVACVLGHEIAHASRRHGMKRLRNSAAIQLLIAQMFKNKDDLKVVGQVAAALRGKVFPGRTRTNRIPSEWASPREPAMIPQGPPHSGNE